MLGSHLQHRFGQMLSPCWDRPAPSKSSSSKINQQGNRYTLRQPSKLKNNLAQKRKSSKQDHHVHFSILNLSMTVSGAKVRESQQLRSSKEILMRDRDIAAPKSDCAKVFLPVRWSAVLPFCELTYLDPLVLSLVKILRY